MFARTGCSAIGHLYHRHSRIQSTGLILLQVRCQSTAPSIAKHFAPSAVISRKNVATSSKSHIEVHSASFGATSTTIQSKRPTLPPNMIFRPAATTGQNKHHSTLAFDPAAHFPDLVYTTAVDTTATRPLVLLFAWMLSKNVHIDKYREFWTKRGYDILTLQTSPMDLLLPEYGGKKNALNVYNYLSAITPRYDEVIVHAFSVGGYQLSEFMYRLGQGLKEGDPVSLKLYQSVKGFVVDSCVFADDCAPGLSRAITRNSVVQPVIESAIANFLRLTKSFTYDRYNLVQAKLFENEMHIPGLLLFSRDDVVSNVQTNYQLAEGWAKKNIPTKTKCWEESTHVLHYKEHPVEYEYEVDKFINEIDITKAPKTRPVPPLCG